MKVLVLSTCYLFPSRARPTAGIFLANMLRRLNQRVGRIDVVSPQAWVPPGIRYCPKFHGLQRLSKRDTWQGIEVYRPAYLSVRAIRRVWLQSRSFWMGARGTCRHLHDRNGYDLVLGTGFGMQAHAAVCAGREFGLPVVTWAIGSDVHKSPLLSAENARLLRHTIAHSDLVLTVSEDIRRQLLSWSPNAGNIRTFYRGIDLDGIEDAPDKLALCSELGLPADGAIMLSAGTAVQTKGTAEFYECFRRLARRHDGLTATWVGDGPELPVLRRRAEQDGISDRLILPGRMLRQRVLKYMQAADVLAFASHAEGLPNVVMEAMAAGLPVVAMDVGGTREVVRDGVTGRLVPPGDTDALYEAVRDCLEHPEAARERAERARRLIRRHFDVARNASVLERILRHVRLREAATVPLPTCSDCPDDVLPIDLLA